SRNETKSRKGSYAWIERGYEWILGLALRHRLVIAVLAVLVIFSSVPLYKMCRQDYIPSDVDESEFDVNVTAREGTSITSMNDVMRQVEQDLMSTRGARLVL